MMNKKIVAILIALSTTIMSVALYRDEYGDTRVVGSRTAGRVVEGTGDVVADVVTFGHHHRDKEERRREREERSEKRRGYKKCTSKEYRDKEDAMNNMTEEEREDMYSRE